MRDNNPAPLIEKIKIYTDTISFNIYTDAYKTTNKQIGAKEAKKKNVDPRASACRENCACTPKLMRYHLEIKIPVVSFSASSPCAAAETTTKNI